MIIEDTYKYQGLRKKLVNTLVSKGIKSEQVLDAINNIPRHVFFEDALRNHSYIDKAFPIGEDQTISQPYTVAKQSELLEITPGDKILEIGTGSGYQCAVLCEIGAKVYSIERHKSLHLKAKKTLSTLKFSPKLIHGDGTLGLKTFAPYDGIIVTAGAPIVPDSLIDQLKIGGKLIIPVGNEKKQTMYKIIKIDESKVTSIDCGTFNFVPLIGAKGW